MLGILWFTVWATVGEAFYDENNWYTTEDGDAKNLAFDWQRFVRDNFSENLRTFAKAYRSDREGDDEMTIQKAKSRLRMLKVFKYTGSSFDFDESNGQMLPLSEGAKYCTMGRHTKVDCNHCTCVAGQLYMCTGMICPEQAGRPQFLSTCREGKKRKIDSCNYCYCHNGHETCSTKDCRLDHGHSALRRPVCQEGRRRRINCNRCVCHNGEEYCTKNPCKVSQQVPVEDVHKNNMEGHAFGPRCVKGSKHKLDSCNLCYCFNGQWFCEKKDCGTKESAIMTLSDIELDSNCKLGTKKRLDCHRCICYRDGWRCNRRKTCRVVGSSTDLLLRTKFQCRVGTTRRYNTSCNYCWCDRRRQWKCTEFSCEAMKHDRSKQKEKVCDNFDIKYIECDNRCDCVGHRWVCTTKECKKQKSSGEIDPGMQGDEEYKYVQTCKPGENRKLDSCNDCYCRYGQWFCQTKNCGEESKSEPNGNPDKDSKKLLTDGSNNQQFSENTDNGNDDDDNNTYTDISGEESAIMDAEHHPDEETGNLDEPNPLESYPCHPGYETHAPSTCKVCYCDNGQWSCKIDCSRMEIIPDESIEIERCTPGKKKKVTCEDCKCAKDGTWNCKKKKNKKCRLFFANGGLLRSNPECEVGRRQRIDTCNYCWCNYDRKWLCSNHTCARQFEGTLREGYDYSETSLRFKNHGNIDIAKILGIETLAIPKCKTGTKRKADACNMCYCRDGLWFCEKKECESNVPEKLRHKKCDKEGSTKRSGCYFCFCDEGEWDCLYACPKKNTMLPLRTDETHCREGSRYEVDDCNYCVCYNGVELCTQKLCWRNEPTPSYSMESECLYGEPVPPPDECNLCVCLNSEILCTVNPCGLRVSEDISIPKCVSGMKRKFDACNKCFCRKGIWFCENKECGVSLISEDQSASGRKRSCIPGKIKRLPCYMCHCPKRLKKWSCRKIPSSRCRKAPPPYLLRAPETLCIEGTKREVDACNYCICYDGVEFCTQKPCWDNPPMQIYDMEPECLPGEPVPPPDQCNECVCLDGEILCTENLCNLRSSAPIVLDSKCKIGSSKKHQCHRCSCYADGWKCKLRKKCRIDPITGDPFLRQGCKAGESYKIDSCNECFCSSSGTLVCTRMACPSLERNNLRTRTNEFRCSEGSRREIDACNYCICKNGAEFCTNEACPDKPPRTGQQRSSSDCVEGHKYKLDDGCNYCVCQGGQEFCTARACLVTVPDGVTDRKTVCSEGEMIPAKDSCNMCVCLQGKITCTNRDCSDMERTGPDAILRDRKSRHLQFRKRKPIQSCVSGETYIEEGEDPDCPNHCICDRNELLCTKRQCNKNNPIIYSNPFPNKNEKIRYPKRVLKQEVCEENQPLPSDDPCNTCICINDRKVCTIIPCSEADETKMDSDEIFLGYKAVKTSKVIKGNMEKKKKGTFCEPFTFFSPDNNRFCRNCFCLHNGLALCLLNLCKYSKDIPHNNSPQELNDMCTPGETGYPTKCVTCTCSDEAKWICTREELAFCHERDCDEKDEFHMGFHPFCATCNCSVKEWFCSIESASCQDYSNVTCPIGTFIHNPQQHCSVCLCGGQDEGSSNMCFTEAKCVRQIISHLKN